MLSRITFNADIIPFEENQAIDFKLLNFIFGNNATGKTTIARLIKKADQQDNSHVIFTDRDEVIEVFNSDFTKSIFRYSDTIPGVFTLGEDRKKNEDIIKELRVELEECKAEHLKDSRKLTETLEEISKITVYIETLCWDETKDIRSRLDFALSGLKRKATFSQRCIESYRTERCSIPFDTLYSDVSRAFDSDIEFHREIEPIDLTTVTKLERTQILKKPIVGDNELEVSKIIDKFNLSDWVKHGLIHFNGTNPQCPFCQQEVPEEISSQLRDYFSQQYERDVEYLARFETEYRTIANEITNYIYSIIAENINGFSCENLDHLLAEIAHLFEMNFERINSKRTEPSLSVDLIYLVDKIVIINSEIEKLNIVIRENNLIVQDRKTHIDKSLELLFNYIANDFLHAALSTYFESRKKLERATTGLEKKVRSLQDHISDLKMRIGEIESKLTSVELTANQMQGILTSFGYNSFKIATTEDNKSFRLLRPNGDKVEDLLSEGELRFVSFLYFYFLVFGSANPTIGDKKKIVVIDDPICSMDNQALFLALGLIHHIIEKCLAKGMIKQVVLLTHNLFFYLNLIEPYKEGRRNKNVKGNVNFIHLKRADIKTIIRQSNENMIESSYELLWSYVLSADPIHAQILLNTMRRILDDFFDTFLGTDKWSVYDNMSEKDKPLCRALLSNVNAGSHSIPDDFNFGDWDGKVDDLKRVFKEFFRIAGYPKHYEAMELRTKKLES